MTFVHLPHPVAIQQHAIKRLFQRHGLAISRGEYGMLSMMCRDGRAPPLAHARTGGTIPLRVRIGALPVYAIYRQELIVTFLPRGVPVELRGRAA